MMNGARLNTGIQGLSASQAAYHGALAYAKDRLQMRAPDGPKFPQKPADPIIVHPDVRRMLLTQKALTEGNRAMAYFVTQQIEISKHAQDADAVKRANDLVAFMIPIIKGFLTEAALEVANNGIQVFGGHGYIQEHGQEQIYRDAKIFTLYEGTSGIQALDLAGRKLMLMQHGQIGAMADIIQAHINENSTPYSKALQHHLDLWQRATAHIAGHAAKDPAAVGAASFDYMMLSGYVVLGWLWSRMHQCAERGQGALGQDFYQGKIHTAAFYFDKILPRCESLVKTIESGSEPLMSIASDQF